MPPAGRLQPGVRISATDYEEMEEMMVASDDFSVQSQSADAVGIPFGFVFRAHAYFESFRLSGLKDTFNTISREIMILRWEKAIHAFTDGFFAR